MGSSVFRSSPIFFICYRPFSCGGVLVANRRGALLSAAFAFKAVTVLILILFAHSLSLYTLYMLVFLLAMLVLAVLAGLSGKQSPSGLGIIPVVLAVLYLVLNAVNILRYISYDLGLPFTFYVIQVLSVLLECAAIALSGLSFVLGGKEKPLPYPGYTHYGGYNSYTSNSYPAGNYTAPSQPGTAPAARQQTAQQLENLKKLKQLQDSGILTQEEFEAKKKQILGI